MLGLLVAASIFQVAAAPPTMVTGADVVRVCRTNTLDERTYCFAYIAGVNDAASDISDAANSVTHCLPERISVGQVAREVADYIARREDLWAARSGGAVVVALHDLYPCEQSTFGG